MAVCFAVLGSLRYATESEADENEDIDSMVQQLRKFRS